jgi:hypothetical protein
MILLGGGATAVPALGAGEASTEAVVGNGADAPIIECAWALNDFNHDWVDKQQYGQDDNPAVGAGSPCDTDGAGGAQMSAADYLTPVIHVKPNAHDDPSQVYVELWAGITSANANPNVYFDISHPDGTPKVQVDAVKYASSATPTRCVGPSGMFGAAMATGQLTQAAVTNMQNECQYQQKSFWYGAFGISKHQPWGKYKVVLTASSPGGGYDTQTFYIWVVQFHNLEKDFTTVSFGNVGPNQHYYQAGAGGDFNFDSPGPLQDKTSVRNTGNSGIALGVKFASLCLTTAPSCTDLKRIDHFDGKFGVGTLANLQNIGNVDFGTSLPSELLSSAKPAPLGPTHYFDLDIKRTLCPNDVGKIEFSIWTENIGAGTYTANPNGIQLVAVPNPICPTDYGHVYPANLGTPQFGNPATPVAAGYWP